MQLKTNLHFAAAVIANLLIVVLVVFFWLQPQRLENTPVADLSQQTVGTTNKNVEQRQDSNVQSIVNEWSRLTPGQHAVIVQSLEGSQYAQLNATTTMVPASTYKLFLVFAVLSHEQQGVLGLDEELPSGVTIIDCIESLLVLSSDECAYELGDVIGWGTIDSFLQASGFVDTVINNYSENGTIFVGDKQTTAADINRLLTRLHAATLLNKENSELMLSFMKEQVHTERIKAGVPDDVVVASKPGWITEQIVENEAAIVTVPTGSYTIVVLTQGTSAEAITTLSRQVYEVIGEVR